MFEGLHRIRLQQGNRLQLPSQLREGINLSTGEKLTGYNMVAAPLSRCVILMSLETFQKTGRCEWAQIMRWGQDLNKIISDNRFHAVAPFYKTDRISESIREAIGILSEELKNYSRAKRNISGKDFERLLYEILTSFGINVQLNVRLLGAEIDLLLLELNKRGIVEFSIIECKRSAKPVGISQVMRLFGLREALKTDLNIKNSLIVTTTGFSPQAKQFANIYQMNLLNYEAFLDWVEANNLIENTLHYPVFRIINLDTRGRFSLPDCLTAYLGAYDSRLVVVGGVVRIELWHESTWDTEYERAKTELVNRWSRDKTLEKLLL